MSRRRIKDPIEFDHYGRAFIAVEITTKRPPSTEKWLGYVDWFLCELQVERIRRTDVLPKIIRPRTWC